MTTIYSASVSLTVQGLCKLLCADQRVKEAGNPEEAWEGREAGVLQNGHCSGCFMVLVLL